MKIACSIVGFLLVAVAGFCSPPCVVHPVVNHHQHHAATYVSPQLLVAGFVPIAIPTYSVTYAVQPAAAQPTAPALQPPGGQPALQPPTNQPAAQTAPAGDYFPDERDAVSALRAACSSCHEKATSAQKGKGLTMFEGDQLAGLQAVAALRIATHVSLDTMPPGKRKLSPTSKRSVLEWLSGLQ